MLATSHGRTGPPRRVANAPPACNKANVARGVNPARWWEYSVSASLMVVLIAMLAGSASSSP